MSSSKAAVSEEARRTLRYVEPLSDTRTPLADFFSILLEKATGFSRNGWPTCVGISARHGSKYAAPDQDRSPTQQTERNAPLPDSSCERFHEELLWYFCERHPRGMVTHC